MTLGRQQLPPLLCIAVLIETISATYFLQAPDFYYSSSALYFISGFLICCLPIFVQGNLVHGKISLFRFLLPALFFLSITLLVVITALQKFKAVPIDYHFADMLPSIELYARKFLTGRDVYENTPEIWGKRLPPYLPFVWLPYLTAVSGGFDLRWISVGAFLTSLLMVLLQCSFAMNKRNRLGIVLLMLALFLLTNFLVHHASEFFTMSYEGVIVFYFVMLCMAVISKNHYFIGLAISFCLLSRFSILFWVPTYLLFRWKYESSFSVFKSLLMITTLLLAALLKPILLGYADLFYHVRGLYEQGFEESWRWYNIEARGINCIGLYKFFTLAQLPVLQNLQLVTTFLSPIVFMAFVTRYVAVTAEHKTLIGLCALKFSLLFFYNFIPVPYYYLFIPPTVVSYIIGFYSLSISTEE